MKTFEVRSRSGNYPVIFGASSEVRAALQEILAGDPQVSALSLNNSVVVADSNTERIAQTVIKSLGIQKSPVIVPAGEPSKSLKMAEHLYQQLIDLKANRRTLILAVGGGVIGDLVGFVAGTFMRGITYVQIPTTLMAQVDSSIGGKVGVNLPAGKNLVGLFYPPRGVVSIP